MKFEYTKPQFVIDAFEVEDVITLSEPGILDDGVDYGELFPQN